MILWYNASDESQARGLFGWWSASVGRPVQNAAQISCRSHAYHTTNWSPFEDSPLTPESRCIQETLQWW